MKKEVGSSKGKNSRCGNDRFCPSESICWLTLSGTESERDRKRERFREIGKEARKRAHRG